MSVVLPRRKAPPVSHSNSNSVDNFTSAASWFRCSLPHYYFVLSHTPSGSRFIYYFIVLFAKNVLILLYCTILLMGARMPASKNRQNRRLFVQQQGNFFYERWTLRQHVPVVVKRCCCALPTLDRILLSILPAIWLYPSFFTYTEDHVLFTLQYYNIACHKLAVWWFGALCRKVQNVPRLPPLEPWTDDPPPLPTPNRWTNRYRFC